MLRRLSDKLSASLFFLFLAFALPWQGNVILCLTVIIARTALSGFRPVSDEASSRFWRILRWFIALTSVMVILNSLLVKGGDVVLEISFLTVRSGGIEFGLTTGFRLLAIVTTLMVLFGSTSIRAVAEFLQARGLPTPLVITLLLTVHFLDTLPHRIEHIYLAQESRGAPVRASFFSRAQSILILLPPLVFSAIVESVDRGSALELRGYRSDVSTLRVNSAGTDAPTWLTPFFLSLTFLVILGKILRWLSVF
jgi:energy-coupling factor transport system permease protein